MKEIKKTNRTLWQRASFDPEAAKNGIIPKELDPDQKEFLYNMMDENLDHARHIENERITFNSIYIALAAGVMAFISTIPEYNIKMGIIVLLFAMGVIAMLLTYRWNSAFKRQTYYAKKCYIMLHRAIFPKGPEEEYRDEAPSKANHNGGDLADEDELLPGLTEAPAYCFSPKDPVTQESNYFARWAHNKMKTQKLFLMFYVLLEVTLVVVAIVFTMEHLGLIGPF
ncbi:MAG: hypothetical protein IKG59_05335 [Firmicutes bacterium]|nr:hypothetical protein [Bacillota bacterium]